MARIWLQTQEPLGLRRESLQDSNVYGRYLGISEGENPEQNEQWGLESWITDDVLKVEEICGKYLNV